MRRRLQRIGLLAVLLGLTVSCSKEIEITDFDPMANFQGGDTVRVEMNLEKAPFEGIVLPSEEGFCFSAKVKSHSDKALYYKIYYQNESYKFDEHRREAEENFYGSWEETGTGFKPIEGREIKDTFRIVGNPRNERLFYGTEKPKQIDQKWLEKRMAGIRKNKEWFEDIKRKAAENKTSVEAQLAADALWLYNYDSQQKGEVNRRERRNPRTGEYKFMLVVADKEALSKIPDYIKDISKTNPKGEFVNPFAYFAQNSISGTEVCISDRVLVTRAVLDGRNGVYIDRLGYLSPDFDLHSSDSLIGTSSYLYDNALFEQFFHDINRNRTIEQIPLIADVEGGNYTLEDYKAMRKKYSDLSSRIKMHPSNTTEPAKSLKLASDRSFIQLSNPKAQDIASARKENVGIRARVGFTYGKYRAKIKFPQLVNSSGVWCGLTNAFWLAYQSEQDWNKRRPCKERGYVKHNKNEQEAQRQSVANYSEIDIEMVKTSKLWHKDTVSGYEPFGNQEFVFACTNWDLACPDPKDFNTGGITQIRYKDKTFELHRWTDTYRALTSRTGLSPKVFESEFYYYEIEWKPTEIIWRIGPSPDKMEVVGYMSERETAIPNNQMTAIVTQEFHYSDWWLPEVFEQGLIPFPQEDLVGKVYEITIE